MLIIEIITYLLLLFRMQNSYRASALAWRGAFDVFLSCYCVFSFFFFSQEESHQHSLNQLVEAPFLMHASPRFFLILLDVGLMPVSISHLIQITCCGREREREIVGRGEKKHRRWNVEIASFFVCMYVEAIFFVVLDLPLKFNHKIATVI